MPLNNNKSGRSPGSGSFYPDYALPKKPSAYAKFTRRFRGRLEQQGYSPSTIRNYSKALKSYFRFIQPQAPGDLEHHQIQRYLSCIGEQMKLSPSYQNHLISAVKLYYFLLEDRPPAECEFARPQVEHKLHKILSKQEIACLLSHAPNLRSRLILVLMYGIGLRPGELIRISRRDLNLRKGYLRIRNLSTSPRQDRKLEIPGKIRSILSQYLQKYNPQSFILEGQKEGNPISQRSLELLVKEAGRVADLPFPITSMTIRHSFAVHMVEAGTNLNYLKDVLGLRSSQQINLYLDIARFRKPNSPLDELEV